MDILLLEPPPTNEFGNMRQFGSIGTYKARIAYPPIDLMKIAGALRKSGKAALLHDANTRKTSIQKLADLVAYERPRLLVFTTSTTAINADMKVAERIKAVSPGTILATFGAHIKGAPRETLEEFPALDVAIYGDAEYVVRDLAHNGYDIAGTEGIFYRDGNSIVGNKPHPPVNQLDEYGIAAHDLVEKGLYRDPFSRRTPLTATYGQVGCSNNCTYCMSNLYGGLRFASVSHFLEELAFIERLGFREVFFIDCGFTNNRTWVDGVLDGMLARKLDLTWWCLSRADRLDHALMERMKRAGCHSIGIGVESANGQIISNVKKRVDIHRVLELVKDAHRLGLRVLLYFQFGLPGETHDTMRETLDFALRSDADLVTFGIATPVPGTAFYRFIESNNYFLTRDWSRFDPTLPPVFDYPALTSNEIFQFSQKAYRDFYLRPSFIAKRFLRQRSLAEFRDNLLNLGTFLRRYLFRSALSQGQ